MTENRFVPEIDRWVALRTSAHWEKKILGMLLASDVPSFLPLMTRVVQYASRRQSSEIPIFSGYVFTSEADFIGNPRVPISCRNQVAQVLKPSDSQTLNLELQVVSRLIESHPLVQERLYGKPGERVRITGGAFVGEEGVILGLKPNRKKIILEISFLNAKLEVEIEEHLVEKT